MRLTKPGIGYGEGTAKPLVTDGLWEVVEPLLPEEPPKPEGGRQAAHRRPGRAHGHTVRPQERHPVGDVASRDGVRVRHDLLAAPEKEWHEAGVWERLHRILLDRLGQADEMDWERASLDSASAPPAPGGREDRSQSDGQGQEGFQAPSGDRPKRRPALSDSYRRKRPRLEGARRGRGWHPADPWSSWSARKTAQAPEEAACRQSLRLSSLPRGTQEERHNPAHRSAGHRVQREAGAIQVGGGTDAVVAEPRNRRLKVRYERRDDIHQAFLDLGCALICWRYVQRFC
jgi:transposase